MEGSVWNRDLRCVDCRGGKIGAVGSKDGDGGSLDWLGLVGSGGRERLDGLRMFVNHF